MKRVMSYELRVTNGGNNNPKSFRTQHLALSTRHLLKGFGILETLLASGVLITVVSAVVGLGAAAVRAGQQAADRQIAYHLANEAIETLRQTRDSRWIDGSGETTWKNEDPAEELLGFCTQFPVSTNTDHACGANDTGASGELELFFDATLQKWQALYCDLDDPNPPGGLDCSRTIAQGGTLGEGARSPTAVDMDQDGIEKVEVFYLLRDGKLLDNSHGAFVGNTYKLNSIDPTDENIARVFERKVRLRQIHNGTTGLCALPSCDGGSVAIGAQAIQIVAQVSWEAQGRRESVESSSILTNWNPEF